jgi:fatty acid desaturase
MRYSKVDGVVVAFLLMFACTLPLVAIYFDRLSWPCLLMLGAFLTVINVTFVSHALHTHAHAPFLASKFLNRLLSAIGSGVQGQTQIIYRHGHFWHHQYTIPYSPFGVLEFIGLRPLPRFLRAQLWLPFMALGLKAIGYCYIAHKDRDRQVPKPTALPSSFASGDDYVAAAIPFVRYKAKRIGLPFRRELYFETLAIVVFRGALLALSWKFFFLFLCPYVMANTVLHRYGEYCEHFGAPADVPQNTSVSCYNRFFNLLTLNGGYHQEHHLHGALHWRELPRVRAEIGAEVTRRVVPGLIFLNPLFDLESARS